MNQPRKVLVVYCGGTIGMKKTERGYVPVQRYFADRLVEIPRLHVSGEPLYTLPPVNLGRGGGLHGKRQGSALVHGDASRRVRYELIELDPLLDSANMGADDWRVLARLVAAHYDDYDAFVIIHGTDTMAYSAAALSFMLDGLGKPVVLTGSQIPLSETRNDAITNLLGALVVAGHFDIPEVCIYFGDVLLRGNRARKISAVGFDAFDAPNDEPLITFGVDVVLRANAIRPAPTRPFKLREIGSCDVAALRMFPGLSASALQHMLEPPLAGLVLETYGAGNIPLTRPDLLDVLRAAVERGVVIVNCTQCLHGSVSAAYESGTLLKEMGIVSGMDLTPEAALTKLAWSLTHAADAKEAALWMASDLRGELTPEPS